jgi:MSHA biogenesis protein MshN
MSVINQLLLDLEKRRASPAERGVLPSHVRALPDGEPSPNWKPIAIGGIAVITVAAAAWLLLAGPHAVRVSSPAQRSITEAAIERVVTASAGVITAAVPSDRSEGPPPEIAAFRLSLELSNPPIESAPLAASRLIGTMDSDAATGEPPLAATVTRSERGSGGKPVVAPQAKSAAVPAGSNPGIRKELRQPTAQELAENQYRKAVVSLHQGRYAEAQDDFQAALNLHPGHHNARQALAGLLIEGKRHSDAERVLQEGVQLAPAQSGFTMMLARLQVNRDEAAQATATLQKGLDHAKGNADYLAFLAALLQRQGRHEEAVEQFQAALRLKPVSGIWWLGLGMSLQAVNRVTDAQDAYGYARATNTLHPELGAFAEQRLRQIQQQSAK